MQSILERVKAVQVKFDSKRITNWVKIIKCANTYGPAIASGSGAYQAAASWSEPDKGRFLECFDLSWNVKEVKASHRIFIFRVIIRAIQRYGHGNTIFAGDGADALDLGVESVRETLVAAALWRST